MSLESEPDRQAEAKMLEVELEALQHRTQTLHNVTTELDKLAPGCANLRRTIDHMTAARAELYRWVAIRQTHIK